MVKFASKNDIDGKPLFKAEPAKSVFKVMTEQEFKAHSVEEIQEIFRTKHIVVHANTPQATPECSFDMPALLNVMRGNQKIHINGTPSYGDQPMYIIHFFLRQICRNQSTKPTIKFAYVRVQSTTCFSIQYPKGTP